MSKALLGGDFSGTSTNKILAKVYYLGNLAILCHLFGEFL